MIWLFKEAYFHYTNCSVTAGTLHTPCTETSSFETSVTTYQFFFHGATAPSELQPTYYQASRSHSDTPQSVGFLWTSDRPVAETSTWQHKHSQQTSIPPAAFEPAIPTIETDADPRLRPRGYWNRLYLSIRCHIPPQTQIISLSVGGGDVY
jgi:hypothetical protein